MKRECGTAVAGNGRGAAGGRGFSLIELLVVIAVIVLLASLTFPITGAVKRAQIQHRARAGLAHMEAAIESYKHKLGYYPPDNAPYWATNQLYYELLGTTNSSGVYFQTLDGSAQVNNTPAAFQAAFGPGTAVAGFMNCVRGAEGDEVPKAGKFLEDLRVGQYLAVVTPVNSTVLGAALEGPVVFQSSAGGKINPWRYNSSKPQHNAKSFDLWIDVEIGGKTYRISNWSEKPLVVSAPYPYP